jgi:hypothetical protein
MMEIVGPERRMEWETIGSFLDFVGMLWCRFRHAATSVPTGTYYSCLVCRRRYRVPWADHTEPGVYVNTADKKFVSAHYYKFPYGHRAERVGS